ncbi:MAG: HlyD family secretion protein [Bacillota bacterium]
MKKRMIGLLVFTMVAAGAYWSYNHYTGDKKDGLELSGTIEATEVNLTARLPGTLEFVSVNAGDTIKKGQVVSRLIRNDLTTQKERDELGVQKAQALLSDIASGARHQEIAEASANVDTARANFDKAGSDYERARDLYEVGAIPQSELEKLETGYKVAKNQLDSAKARLGILESGSRPDQIKATEIELERSKTVLKSTEALLEDTVITSPIDGTVVTRNFEPGEFVSAGAAVVTVADLNNLWIRVYVSTDDLPTVSIGQQVSFSVSGLNEEFYGTISEIASKGEFTPKTIQTREERTNIVYAVKVKIDNNSGIFKPGMPADVVIRD